MKNSDQPTYPVVTPGFLYGDGSAEIPSIEHYGLSKREYFAAMAMQGYCACFQSEKFMSDISDKDIAGWAVNMADALLAELDKED